MDEYSVGVVRYVDGVIFRMIYRVSFNILKNIGDVIEIEGNEINLEHLDVCQISTPNFSCTIKLKANLKECKDIIDGLDIEGKHELSVLASITKELGIPLTLAFIHKNFKVLDVYSIKDYTDLLIEEGEELKRILESELTDEKRKIALSYLRDLTGVLENNLEKSVIQNLEAHEGRFGPWGLVMKSDRR